MREVQLWRMKRHDQGTEGMLLTSGFQCYSLELPWRNNQQSVSSIPAGEYTVTIRQSPKYGRIYWVTKVPNRSWILIHAGNWAGDVSKGFKTHVNGCILLGQKHGSLQDQVAVLNSRTVVRNFMEYMKYEDFKFEIMEAF